MLSLFGGIETGYAALRDAGIPIENYWSSEIDKNAIKVSAHNYPEIVHIGDVCSVSVANLPFVPDLLLAGFPCTDLSFAGKQAGLDGTRSGLFFEAVRILRECQAVNPYVLFLFENVPMAKRHEWVINEMLGLRPWANNAALVSAQNRKRLWWSNIRTKKVGLFEEVHTDFPQPKDRGIMIADILEAEVDKKYFLSGAAMERISRTLYSKPQVNPEKTGTINRKNNSGQLSCDSGTTLIGVVNYNGNLREVEKSNCIDANFHKGMDNHGQSPLSVHQQDRINNKNGKARSVPAGTHGNAQHHTVTEVCGTALRRQVKKGAVQPRTAEYRDDGKSNCVTQFQELSCVTQGPTLRRLTPVEVCRLFTLPDDLFQDENGNNIIAETNQYKALGNGWVMKVVSHIFSFLPELK